MSVESTTESDASTASASILESRIIATVEPTTESAASTAVVPGAEFESTAAASPSTESWTWTNIEPTDWRLRLRSHPPNSQHYDDCRAQHEVYLTTAANPIIEYTTIYCDGDYWA